MRFERADLLAASAGRDVLAFTSNACLLSDPTRLVMGAGAARAVRDEYAVADRHLGALLAIRFDQTSGLVPDYHIEAVRARDSHGSERIVCAVQVKRSWRQDGDLELTATSLDRFARWLGPRSAAMNMPLVGRGGFADREPEVRELVERSLSGSDVIVCHL